MSETVIQTEFRWATRHAYDRAWEHFGVEFRKPDWQAVVCDIIDTKTCERTCAILLADNAAGRRERWLVERNGVQMIVIYAPDIAEVITCGPRTNSIVAPQHLPAMPQKRGKRKRRAVRAMGDDPMEGWE